MPSQPLESGPTGHKRSCFLFVVRESDRHIYFVRKGDSYGAPGGKFNFGEDFNDLFAAVREFEEETGCLPPGIEHTGKEYVASCGDEFYNYVSRGDQHHACTYFYRVVPDAECDTLHVGKSPDKEGGEEEVLWFDSAGSWDKVRPHIKKGLSLIRRNEAGVLPGYISRSPSRSPPYRSLSRAGSGRSSAGPMLYPPSPGRKDSLSWRNYPAASEAASAGCNGQFQHRRAASAEALSTIGLNVRFGRESTAKRGTHTFGRPMRTTSGEY